MKRAANILDFQPRRNSAMTDEEIIQEMRGKLTAVHVLNVPASSRGFAPDRRHHGPLIGLALCGLSAMFALWLIGRIWLAVFG